MQPSVLVREIKEEETTGNQAALPSNEVRIEIAGICVALRCGNARFIQQVEKQYEGFLSTRHPLVIINVLITDRLKDNTSGDVLVSLADNKASFIYCQTAGYVDVGQGIGQLEMTPWIALSGRNAVENFLRVLYSLLCVQNDGFLFHAAGIVKGGNGYLFFGHAGSGKTTVSRLSSDYTILSDDLVVVRAINGLWRVFGTPFWGDMQDRKKTNESAEIKGFFALVKDQKVHFEKLDYSKAIAELISSVPVVYRDPTLVEELIGLCSDVASITPCYRMHFLLNNSFWRYIDELA